MALVLEITPIGFEEAAFNLHGIAVRARDPLDDRRIFRPLEEGEARHFDALHPKYHRTLRLRRSLTGPVGNDAIRHLHGTGAAFGTRVPYARAAGSRGGDLLLVIDEQAQSGFAEAVLDYILGERMLGIGESRGIV